MNLPDGPIGVFDSGYGGLTVLKALVERLPAYDFLYLGDNARTPYGSRSFDTVYHYTLECVRYLFNCGCPLVIIACNTASAKALRTIQQKDLPQIDPLRRVLGVIRPTAESIGSFTQSGEIGILATAGTVTSGSYPIEISHFYPELRVYQQACPMWVPLVENHEFDTPGADYFIEKYLDALFRQSEKIDTLLLGCTHYPLLINKIQQFTFTRCQIVEQGDIVARSLEDYLRRHPEIEVHLAKGGQVTLCTTDEETAFNRQAGLFFGRPAEARHIELSRFN